MFDDKSSIRQDTKIFGFTDKNIDNILEYKNSEESGPTTAKIAKQSKQWEEESEMEKIYSFLPLLGKRLPSIK